MNVNNVTRKFLPIAASAAISLGAMTSCSSAKDEKQEPTYVQTEMLKLDNTLDSLKSAAGDNERAFVDYYLKSNSAINNAKLDSNKKRDFKGSDFLTIGGLVLMGLGFLSAFGAANQAAITLKDNAIKRFNASLIGVGVGIATFLGGTLAQDITAYNNNKKFEQYKEQKLNNLETEKLEYLNTPEK